MLPGGHAADQLGLGGTTALTGRLGLNGRAGVHPGEGDRLLPFLRVPAEETGLEAVELGAVRGDLEARREVLSQEERRAIAFRDADLRRVCCAFYSEREREERRQNKNTPSELRGHRTKTKTTAAAQRGIHHPPNGSDILTIRIFSSEIDC